MIAVFDAFETLRARIRKPTSRIFPFVRAPNALQCINQGVFLSREFVGMVERHEGMSLSRCFSEIVLLVNGCNSQ